MLEIPFELDSKQKELKMQIMPYLKALTYELIENQPKNIEKYMIDFLIEKGNYTTSGLTKDEKKELELLRTKVKYYRDLEKHNIISSQKELFDDIKIDNKLISDDSDSEEYDDVMDEKEEEIITEKLMNIRKIKETQSSIKSRISVSAEVYGLFNKKENFIPKVIPKSEDQMNRIRGKIISSFIFSSLDKKDLEVVINAMEEKRFKLNENVITEGEDGDCLYIVETGSLNCFKTFNPENSPRFLKTYESGDSFGELALLYNCPRAATIVCSSDECILWSLDRETFNHIVKDASQKKREKYEKFLRSIDILSIIDDYELGQICDALKDGIYKKNEYIIREGEIGDLFYIIEEGKCFVTKTVEPGKPEIIIKELKEGDYFGERALLKGEPRYANIIVESDVAKLISLDRFSFNRLLGPIMNLLKRNVEKYQVYCLNNNENKAINKNIEKNEINLNKYTNDNNINNLDDIKNYESKTIIGSNISNNLDNNKRIINHKIYFNEEINNDTCDKNEDELFFSQKEKQRLVLENFKDINLSNNNSDSKCLLNKEKNNIEINQKMNDTISSENNDNLNNNINEDINTINNKEENINKINNNESKEKEIKISNYKEIFLEFKNTPHNKRRTKRNHSCKNNSYLSLNLNFDVKSALREKKRKKTFSEPKKESKDENNIESEIYSESFLSYKFNNDNRNKEAIFEISNPENFSFDKNEDKINEENEKKNKYKEERKRMTIEYIKVLKLQIFKDDKNFDINEYIEKINISFNEEIYLNESMIKFFDNSKDLDDKKSEESSSNNLEYFNKIQKYIFPKLPLKIIISYKNEEKEIMFIPSSFAEFKKTFFQEFKLKENEGNFQYKYVAQNLRQIKFDENDYCNILFIKSNENKSPLELKIIVEDKDKKTSQDMEDILILSSSEDDKKDRFDLEHKIDNEIIGLVFNKSKEENDEFKIEEKLKANGLKSCYKINIQKMIELRNIFTTEKLRVYCDDFFDLENGKVCLVLGNKYLICDKNYFNKLFEIQKKILDLKYQKFEYSLFPKKEILFMIELDNHDLVICYDYFIYYFDIYRLSRDGVYFLYQRIEDSNDGHHNTRKLTINNCHIYYKLKKVIKLKKNRFMLISTYGIKIYSLDYYFKPTIILINDFNESIEDCYKLNENQFIFFNSELILPEIKFTIEKICINNITNEEKYRRLFELKNDDYFGNKVLNRIEKKSETIISNLVLSISRKKIFETKCNSAIEQWKFHGVYFRKKNFIASISNHLLIFDLLNFELIKDFIFVEEKITNPICITGNKIIKKTLIRKWNNSNDNQFLLIWENFIILFELNEIQLNGKKTFNLTVIAHLNKNCFNYLQKFDENRFYVFNYFEEEDNYNDYRNIFSKLNNYLNIYS